jgi:bla regulator protein BlaR1
MPEAPGFDWLGVLGTVWMTGTALVLARWMRGWWAIRRALRGSPRVALPAPIPAHVLPTAIEPGVFGIFRPVLLLPEGIVDTLPEEQLDAIVAHELAHVRRRDNLTAALHMVVEALFWFHPLVWWIGARLLEERERACDEEVVRLGKRPRIYAQGILNVCKHYLESPLPCASGVTGADLKQRVREIIHRRAVYDLTPARKFGIGAAAFVAIAIPLWIGAMGVHAQGLVFDVASIRPSDPNSRGLTMRDTPEGGLSGSGLTLKFLIQVAYNVESFQITGGPGWVETERFDVSAKTDNADNSGSEQTRVERWRERMRALLADRFKLTLRKESSERPVFALVESKGGHKLGPATDERGNGIGRNRGLITGEKVPMAMLAKLLASVVSRPVFDRTGLNGNYVFRLQFAEEMTGKEGVPSETGDGASIFAAIQEQLGLKLESTRGPVEMLAIERAEKPTEN